MTQTQRGFVHIPFLLIILALVFASAVIPVKRNYNNGKSSVQGVYLAKGGDDSSSGGSSGGSDDSQGGSSGGSSGGSGSSSGGSSGGSSGSSSTSGSSSGSSGSTTSGGSTTATKASPTASPEVHKAEKMETPEPKQQETNKGTFTQGNVKVQFEIHDDGQVEIQTEAKDGGKTTKLEDGAEDEAVRELETELEKDDVKIATAPGQIALVNKKVGALTSFPISVDPTTRQLSVTTPAGVKTVAILPQKAVDNLLASHVMDDVVNEKVNNSLASIPEMVRMEVENGVLGFKVNGTKTHKLLGLIPIKTGVNAFVSAENGQVVESSQSLLGRILDRIAP